MSEGELPDGASATVPLLPIIETMVRDAGSQGGTLCIPQLRMYDVQ